MHPLIANALTMAHPDWQETLRHGVSTIDRDYPQYFEEVSKTHFLPHPNPAGKERLFAAFTTPPQKVRHVLFGEAPYPRAESANGLAFMDAAVSELFSPQGLSRRVNRATSLRNWMKLLLICEGRLNSETPNDLSTLNRDDLITHGEALQDNLIKAGFLLMNTALIYRTAVAPQQEARYWQGLIAAVLTRLATTGTINLLLWGRVAQNLIPLLNRIGIKDRFSLLQAPHPYNLSFIQHLECQTFFKDLHILRKAED